MDTLDQIKFVCPNHDMIMETVNELTSKEEACNFCGAAPIIIVYRSWGDRIFVACKTHEEIVLEMIERDNVLGLL